MKIRIIIDVTMDVVDETVADVQRTVESAIEHSIMGRDLLTYGLAAEVADWTAKLEITA